MLFVNFHFFSLTTFLCFQGFPFSNLRTIADGVEPERSTGVPYYYTSDMEMSTIDNEADTAISMSITLMEVSRSLGVIL